MQTGKLRFCVATVSFMQLAIVFYDSVGLCQQCYVFVLPGARQHQNFCEKDVTSHIIATFENRLLHLCHDICRQAYRSISAFNFLQIRKAMEQVIRLRIHCHPELDSKLVRFMPHILNKPASIALY